MIRYIPRLALTAPAALLLASLGAAAQAQGTLRIAMTASDVPTTTGAPDNGFEGLRLLGYPVYEGLALWNLTRADKLAEIRPGLAESWEQDENDKSKWIFHLRRSVKFHDGSDFNADAVIWNLDRYFKPDSQAGRSDRRRFCPRPRSVDRRLPQDRRLHGRDRQPTADQLFPGRACLPVLFEPGAIPEDRLVDRVRQVAVGHRAVQDQRIPAPRQRHAEPQRRLLG